MLGVLLPGHPFERTEQEAGRAALASMACQHRSGRLWSSSLWWRHVDRWRAGEGQCIFNHTVAGFLTKMAVKS
jgi:hypothetical protein